MKQYSNVNRGIFPPSVALAVGLLGSSCATQGSPSPTESALAEPMDPRDKAPEGHLMAPPPSADPVDACGSLVAQNTVKRSAVVEVVDQGLGQWIKEGVKVERSPKTGRFQGWKVLSLHLANPCYAAVDIRPGDVVLSVNGDSVEQPPKAHEVFNSMRTAKGIDVVLMRGGQKKTVRFEIEDGQ